MSARPLLAEWHRGKRQLPFRRYYARVGTALPKLVSHLLINGQPGDTIQISLREFGTWVADLKIHAGGRISLHFLEEV